MLNNSHRSAGFAVLKAPDIPSALVEMGCLSNREEERALRTPSYRRKVAAGITRSINDYFDSLVKA
jgi:N-acetylmuramoyl-L-alanine amidase